MLVLSPVAENPAISIESGFALRASTHKVKQVAKVRKRFAKVRQLLATLSRPTSERADESESVGDEFADWESKSKGNQPGSDAERLRLINLEKENAQLKKEIAQLKASKQNNPSTSASAVGNKGCFKCGKEGHRADRCPDNKPTPTKSAPATPKTAGAKSAGQSGKKVSFSKLQLDTAVKNTVQETVAAMEKKGWQKP